MKWPEFVGIVRAATREGLQPDAIQERVEKALYVELETGEPGEFEFLEDVLPSLIRDQIVVQQGIMRREAVDRLNTESTVKETPSQEVRYTLPPAPLRIQPAAEQSPKAEKVRAWFNKWIEQRIVVGTAGQTKMLADCTAADLSAAGKVCHANATIEKFKGDRFVALANLLHAAKVEIVADLPLHAAQNYIESSRALKVGAA